jgi:hypothetical protein
MCTLRAQAAENHEPDGSSSVQVLTATTATITTRGSFGALVADLGARSIRRVRTGPIEVGLYNVTRSTIEGVATVVCLPESAEEVQACVRTAPRPALRRADRAPAWPVARCRSTGRW